MNASADAPAAVGTQHVDQEESTPPEQMAQHAQHAQHAPKAKKPNEAKKVVVLPDGTQVIKSKKKKHLPDGSLLIKLKTESIAVANTVSAKSNHQEGAHLIRTETRRIRPNGSSLITTTTERIDELSELLDAPKPSDEQQSAAQSTVLPDGTRVIKSENKKILQDGRLDTITTVVQISDAPQRSNAPIKPRHAHHHSHNHGQKQSQAQAPSFPATHQRSNEFPQVDSSGTNDPLPPGFTGIDGQTQSNMRPVSALQHNQNDEICPEIDFSCIDAPLPLEYIASKNDDCTKEKSKSANFRDTILEINDSNHEPLPPEFVASSADNAKETKVSKIGAQFVSMFSSFSKSEKEKKMQGSHNHKGSIAPNPEERKSKYEEQGELSSFNHKDSQSNAPVAPDDKSTKTGFPGVSTFVPDDKSTKGDASESLQAHVDGGSIIHTPGFTNDGLAVAKAIYDDDDDVDNGPVFAAIEYDPFSKPPLYKNRRCRVYTALALLIICVITAIGVVYATKRTKEKVLPVVVFETPTPTLAPTPPPLTDRDFSGIRELIEARVLQRNATFQNMTKQDPRFLALDWIVHRDPMEVEVFDDNLSQRYILALLAFSFDSLAWKNCGNYTLSLSDEVDKEDTADSCFVKDINNMTEEYHVWLSATDECEWYGVTCFDGLVRWVELPDIDLIGEIPPELGKLRFLQILDFSGNCLYGTIPSEIGTLSNLQQLELSQNGLSGFVPDELFEASSLSKLDLGYQYWNDWNCTRSNGDVVSIGHSKGDPENDINYGLEGEILGTQIGKLKYLKEITVNDNYFSGEIASEIGELKQLVKLNAGTNSFSGFIPDEITKLEKLQELWLEQNYITGELPQDIGNMKSLDSLSVYSVWGNGNMTGIIPDSLYNLTKLKFLFLQGNAFSGTISQEIGNLKRLQQLTFSNNDFSGTLPTELGLCEELDWLRIEGTNIEGSVPEEVCLLRNKKLNSDDEFMEFFVADCLKDNETMEPFYECHCCYSCCDHTTAQCQIVGK